MNDEQKQYVMTEGREALKNIHQSLEQWLTELVEELKKGLPKRELKLLKGFRKDVISILKTTQRLSGKFREEENAN